MRRQRWHESNLMALAASVVVFLYAAGVGVRWESAPWYEWAAAAAGAGFALWFWFTEYARAQRLKRRRAERQEYEGGER